MPVISLLVSRGGTHTSQSCPPQLRPSMVGGDTPSSLQGTSKLQSLLRSVWPCGSSRQPLPPPWQTSRGTQGSGWQIPAVMLVPPGPGAGRAAWWGVPPPGPCRAESALAQRSLAPGELRAEEAPALLLRYLVWGASALPPEGCPGDIGEIHS